MKHDAACEITDWETKADCKCAERTYLATATPEETEAYHRRTGYDANAEPGASELAVAWTYY